MPDSAGGGVIHSAGDATHRPLNGPRTSGDVHEPFFFKLLKISGTRPFPRRGVQETKAGAKTKSPDASLRSGLLSLKAEGARRHLHPDREHAHRQRSEDARQSVRLAAFAATREVPPQRIA